MMKRLWLLGALIWLPLGAETPAFSGGLSDAEAKSAGLDKLTAGERAKLDELVARHRQDAAAKASEAVDTKTADGAEKPSAGPAGSTASTKPEILKGRIAGALTGWEEGRVLVLEDGQRWQVVSKGSYRAAPVRKSPGVELFPLSNGDYILTIHSVPRRAQVRRVTADAN